ncbi:MAG: hypothetical protein E7365_04560 [Clostridiales bacterium]|nr:hypothetical protein [Clostridiales bacterium]
MTDLTPLIFILALTNKNGFNSIKNAFEAADGFTTKINNITNMMSMLPNFTGLLNNINNFSGQSSPQTSENYVDTLKDIMSNLK